MFRCTTFGIENRPALDYQRIEDVLSTLVRLDAPNTGRNPHKRIELAKWLSDWHLVAFLGSTGLFSEVCCNLVC